MQNSPLQIQLPGLWSPKVARQPVATSGTYSAQTELVWHITSQTKCCFYALVFQRFKQMRYNVLITELQGC